jgi:17beta-estradiol 17-dehydrogenase / very-long-chain 3-oxoacyl-CoA reductase
MDSVVQFLQNIPQPVQWAFAGIGALFLGSKVLSYLQLVLSSFVLSGTSVCILFTPHPRPLYSLLTI